jgi:hypothetical protein
MIEARNIKRKGYAYHLPPGEPNFRNFCRIPASEESELDEYPLLVLILLSYSSPLDIVPVITSQSRLLLEICKLCCWYNNNTTISFLTVQVHTTYTFRYRCNG